jgi:two-component system, LytTR family, sensor kinase
LFILLNFSVSYVFERGPHPAIFSEIFAEFLLVIIFLIVSTLLKVIRDSLSLQDMKLKMQEIEKQKMEAELRAIKSQVNPHFFFNTLNSLYSLSLDKSDRAPELILKLSDLMRYVIYETKDDLVAIEKQLDFLQSYVYLERLRSPEFLKISFTVTGENKDLRIAPLLFIAFVENSFKHGSKDRTQNPFIDIRFDLTGREKISFSVENTVDPGPKYPRVGGVGLANVKKQLELIYPDKHHLNIHADLTRYKVELTIFV